jgi:oligo-alginate lyase
MSDKLRSTALFATLLLGFALTVAFDRPGFAEEGSDLPIVLPDAPQHPFMACTTGELARLRDAYTAEGAAHEVVAARVKAADAYIGKPVVFPPRGGQHNQWYQCQDCQMGLKTVDDTHHRCPKCEKVYTGYPYDDRIFSSKHYANLTGALASAWAYAITQNEKYVRHTADVLLGYAVRYLEYPYHDNTATKNPKKMKTNGGHLFEQTLNEASVLSSFIAPAYDLIHDSGVLSDSDHAAIREGLLLPMLQNMDNHKAGKSNWQSWHNAAMLWGGAVIGDPEWVEKSISAEGNGFREQMKISVMPEGMWYENSWGYHFYTLSALTIQAEGARRLGIDLWNDETFKKMFALPVHYTMADGSLPRFGDDVNSSAKGGGKRMEQAYHAYQDPTILPFLSSSPSFESILLGRDARASASIPALESEVLKGAGHAILRTKGEAGLTAAMTFGPYGGGHGHYDKLSFVLFGYERELGVDAGRARSQAYRLPIHKNWYKASISHNTVLVDGASQQPAQGKLLSFETTDHYAAVSASCDDAYPGVKHTRTLVLMPAYMLVVDQLSADKERRFDWVYHNRGKSVTCEAATSDPADAYPGQDYIENAVAGNTNKPIQVQFVDGKMTTHMTMTAQDDTGILIGDGVGASTLERVPMAMVTRNGRSATFVAVLEPVKDGKPIGVQSVSIEQGEGGLVVSVNKKGGTDKTRIMKTGKVEL